MQRLISLCLWQVVIVGILLFTTPNLAAQEAGIRIRGPKSTDVYPFERYGPIQSTDTLWKIAITVRPDPSFSVYQVMQALFELNPSAFADGNLNHLINGQYLRIPSPQDIRNIDQLAAKKKAERDDVLWKNKTGGATETNIVAKKVQVPEEETVKKKDLDAAKTEINDKLVNYGSEQKARLETIQNDVLDSIDGLQAILKENESLKERLTNFNQQLDIVQEEVAKGQEIKLKMDNMLQMQQALLAKAEQREQELLLAKQQAELEKEAASSGLWWKVLLGTLPGLLVVGGLFFFFMKKKNNKTEEKAHEKSAAIDPELTIPTEEDVTIDLEAETDIFAGDLVDLDEELLNNELSDDDVIHLDDDIDDLGDLETISLDDDDDLAFEDSEDDELLDSETAQPALKTEDEVLEGGQLGQDDLNDLLDDLDDELDEPGEPLEGGTLGQDDLDALFSGGLELDEPEVDEIPEGADITDPDDIDALLAASAAPVQAEAEPEADEIPDGADVTDPDDIDALLAASAAPVKAEAEPEADEIPDGADVTDPDDIDALLAASAVPVKAEAEPEADEIPDGADVTDPDDIDALLAASAAPVKAEAEAEPEADEIPDGVDVTDPDDIDALLAASAAPVKAEAEPEADEIPDGADVTDPDDIDALLASIEAENTNQSSKNNELPETEDDIEDIVDAIVEESSLEESSDNETEVDVISKELEENKQIIENFTEEYVSPFLAVDFGDINNTTEPTETDLTEPTESDIVDIDDVIEQEASKVDDVIGDDFNDDIDIDDLIADVQGTDDTFDEDDLDIGDDLLEELDEQTNIDDETLAALEGDFDESTLSELLKDDDDDGKSPIELSPDFTDSNVLADLLEDRETKKEDIAEAHEMNDIQELDSLDFDELLANIEEESNKVSSNDFNIDTDDDFLDIEGISDDLTENNDEFETDDDFISVDSLLSSSLDDNSNDEPYEHTNIDVGLNEFPEFTGGMNNIDVDDEDDNGMAAKLDLAKVYLEIGDKDNAEAILKDVVKSGDAEQQFEAQQLLGGL